MIDYSCPKCSTAMHSPESETGKQLQCPQCKGTVVVPVSAGPKKGVIIGVVSVLVLVLVGCPLLIVASLLAISTIGNNASRTFSNTALTMGGS
jgi:uncharacterized paraquat-inducible protein A